MEKRIITADKIIEVETKVTEHDRIVDWSDIETEVSYDEYASEAPWDDDDGWKHDVEWNPSNRYSDDMDIKEMQGYGWSSSNRESFLITLTDEQVSNWGFSKTEFYPGASKQVSAELFAATKARNLEKLVKWYSDGWEWYIATAKYEELDIIHTVGGIDSSSYAEEMAETELKHEVAAELEELGYIVENVPVQKMYTSADRMRDSIKRHLHLGYWPEKIA